MDNDGKPGNTNPNTQFKHLGGGRYVVGLFSVLRIYENKEAAQKIIAALLKYRQQLKTKTLPEKCKWMADRLPPDDYFPDIVMLPLKICTLILTTPTPETPPVDGNGQLVGEIHEEIEDFPNQKPLRVKFSSLITKSDEAVELDEKSMPKPSPNPDVKYVQNPFLKLLMTKFPERKASELYFEMATNPLKAWYSIRELCPKFPVNFNPVEPEEDPNNAAIYADDLQTRADAIPLEIRQWTGKRCASDELETEISPKTVRVI